MFTLKLSYTDVDSSACEVSAVRFAAQELSLDVMRVHDCEASLMSLTKDAFL